MKTIINQQDLFKISVNLDEVSNKLERSLAFLAETGVRYAELRTINGLNLIHYSLPETEDILKVVRKYNIKISAVASPLFKWFSNRQNPQMQPDLFGYDPYIDALTKRQHIDKIIKQAGVLGTKRVRVFSGLATKHNSKVSEEDFKLLEYALTQATKNDITLLIENEPACNISQFDDFMNTLRNPKLFGIKAWFDIANVYEMEKRVTFKQLEELSQFLEYIHVKDPVGIGEHKYVPVGQGIINYKRIFTDLQQCLTRPVFISLETHVKTNKYQATKESLLYIRSIINSPRTRYAIVGAGRISVKHATAYKKNANSELRGVFDIDSQKSAQAAKRYDCVEYHSLNSLLNDQNVDVVSICTPHDTHIKIAKAIISSGKIVLCEKPFALNLVQLEAFLEDSRSANNTYIVFQNHFNSPVLRSLNFLNKGKLGSLQYFSLNIRWWRDSKYFQDWHGNETISGGLLFTQAIHGIELLGLMTELKVQHIYGYIWKSRDNIKANDMAIAVVKLKNGVFGNIEVCLDTKQQNLESSLFTVWDKGTVKIGGLSLSEDAYTFSCETGVISQQIFDDNRDNYGNGHIKLIQTLSNVCLGIPDEGQEFLVKPSSLVDVIHFTDEVYRHLVRK